MVTYKDQTAWQRIINVAWVRLYLPVVGVSVLSAGKERMGKASGRQRSNHVSPVK